MCLGSRLKLRLQRLELERLLMLGTLSGSGYVSKFFDALPCVEEEHEEDEAECPKEVDHRLSEGKWMCQQGKPPVRYKDKEKARDSKSAPQKASSRNESATSDRGTL